MQKALILKLYLNSANFGRLFSTMSPDPFHVGLLSERAQKGLKYPSTGPINLAYSNDPFHPVENKEGIIKLSSAGMLLKKNITIIHCF